MKYIDEYRDRELVGKLKIAIENEIKGHYTFMEVCGGHTMAIQKFGLPNLIPDQIKLISGPGCPVCVTGRSYIDAAIEISHMEKTIVVTFGDLIRVPGKNGHSLEKAKAQGADVRIVFSPIDGLNIAQRNPAHRVVFIAIGFETTAPGVAITLIEAKKQNIHNFFVLSSLKIMPPAMQAIVEEGTEIDGYICPGHVSTITGSEIFEFIPKLYNLACVISGFEPLDIMQSIYMLINQINNNVPTVQIQYKRAVQPKGNVLAKRMMGEVFEPVDAWWRGIGVIEKSGLGLNSAFEKYDIKEIISINLMENEEDTDCICGEILKGKLKPTDCKLFTVCCVPEDPVGACMVSSEGTCHAYYKYLSYGQ